MTPTPTGDVAGYIDDLVSHATDQLTGDELLLVSAQGERSDFVRFNHALVRQAGSVSQLGADLDLSAGRRHATMSIGFSFDPDADRAALSAAVDRMRTQRAAMPDDPFFAPALHAPSTSQVNPGTLPLPEELVDTVTTAGAGDDLVGIWASGDQFSAFANSHGQRNWFSSTTFNFDWSLYLHTDKAAKQSYAGFDWSAETFEARLAEQRRLLEALARPVVEVPPGDYRAYLTPNAVSSLVDILSWGGFGLRSHRSKTSPLMKMTAEDRTLSPAITIIEDTANGVAPNFASQGHVRPDSVPLIVDGVFAHHLVSPRSAREYGVADNGASNHESPSSISMAPGALDPSEAMAALGTGLYIGNLWYLNFSDRPNARMTGMTRFATFWVDGGEIVGPVTPLRFDDTAYGLFGDRLEALTSDVALLLDPSSYGARSTDSARLPGMLVRDMRFTL